jgi:hypothetical protein
MWRPRIGVSVCLVNPSDGSLRALDGGGRTTADAISVNGYLTAAPRQPYDDWARFRLIRQVDGSYALQTSKGYYVTAVNGGGVVMGPKTPVVLQTDRTQVQDWEKFRIVDTGSPLDQSKPRLDGSKILLLSQGDGRY